MTGPHLRVGIIWERWGPYHHARIANAVGALDLHGIEVVQQDDTYSWDIIEGRQHYSMHRADGQPITKTLTQVAPQVLAVPGWDAPYVHESIIWAISSDVPVVIMSDSNVHDSPRMPITELIKRAIVANARCGFAAGRSAKSYLIRLGMSADRIFMGYDVVDNDHFARPFGKSHGRGFLTVARFVPKKNLEGLLKAYALYRSSLRAGETGWSLTLVGDGPLRSRLDAMVAKLEISEYVKFAGFRQYNELPAFYHAAGAFVLPSTVEQWGLVVNEAMAAGLPVLVSAAAGCAQDLVRPGVNGSLFDPGNPHELALKLSEIAAEPGRAAAMGDAGLSIIAGWNLAAFTEGLRNAANCAYQMGPKRPGLIPLLAVGAMHRLRRKRRA